MGRRGKGVGRKKQSSGDKQAAKKPMEGNPKSMVIRIGAGEVGSSVSQLVQDMRQVMQPDTAVRLKVRLCGEIRHIHGRSKLSTARTLLQRDGAVSAP